MVVVLKQVVSRLCVMIVLKEKGGKMTDQKSKKLFAKSLEDKTCMGCDKKQAHIFYKRDGSGIAICEDCLSEISEDNL